MQRRAVGEDRKISLSSPFLTGESRSAEQSVLLWKPEGRETSAIPVREFFVAAFSGSSIWDYVQFKERRLTTLLDRMVRERPGMKPRRIRSRVRRSNVADRRQTAADRTELSYHPIDSAGPVRGGVRLSRRTNHAIRTLPWNNKYASCLQRLPTASLPCVAPRNDRIFD